MCTGQRFIGKILKKINNKEMIRFDSITLHKDVVPIMDTERKTQELLQDTL